MLDSTLALFVRSFRVDARSIRAHVMRLAFAAVILVFLLQAHLTIGMFAAPGLHVFESIAWVNFALITVAGIGIFPATIAEEKEEDSLGLLKMAGISPVALLLGKSTTALLSMLLVLAVQFPFVLLSITLGGVLISQVIACMVALAAYLIFVANLGLAASVLCSTTRRASSLATLTLVILLIVLPIYAVLPAPTSAGGIGSLIMPTLQHGIAEATIIYRIPKILTTGFSGSAISPQVISSVSAALALFGFSWAIFERFTGSRHGMTRIETIVMKRFRRKTRSGVGRAWQAALTWKEFNFIAGGMKGLLLRHTVYFVLIVVLSLFLRELEATSVPFEESAGGAAIWIALIGGAIEIGLFAARVFSDEVRAQTLPLLLMLPTSTSRIAWSKFAAIAPVILPTIGWLVLGAWLDPTDCSDFLKEFKREPETFLYIFTCYVLIVHLAAYLSLLIKWVAFPFAFLIVIFLQFFIFGFLAPLFFPRPSDSQGIIYLITLGWGVVMICLELAIVRRLETLAGR